MKTTTIEMARKRLEAAETIADDLSGRRQGGLGATRIGDYTIVDDDDDAWIALTQDYHDAIDTIVGHVLDGDYDYLVESPGSVGYINLCRSDIADIAALDVDPDVVLGEEFKMHNYCNNDVYQYFFAQFSDLGEEVNEALATQGWYEILRAMRPYREEVLRRIEGETIPPEFAYQWGHHNGDREMMRDHITEDQWAFRWAIFIGDRKMMRDRITDPFWVVRWNRIFPDDQIELT